MAPEAAFYCVADARYFAGAVGLVNSLRLVGHDEPIYLLDCGLTGPQRELLAACVTVVAAPTDAPPWLLKTAAPLAHPADVMVLLDTDVVVTRSLRPLIERAAGGHLVAFENPIDRFVPEWGELLDFGRTFWRRNEPGYPFTYADQDVLNAILATRVAPDLLVALDARLAPTPPFTGLRVIDERALRCAYDDGVEPYLVHHHVVRPWLEPTHHGVYSRLLRRLLVGPEIPIRVPKDAIPLWLRSGPLAWAKRVSINARERFRWHVREPLEARIRRRARAAG